MDAAAAGFEHGLAAHGSLDPWRILVDATGGAHLIGYGLPSLEVADWRTDADAVPADDTLRYTPPERVLGEPEDVRSDLFTLCLIAAELATGRPVYTASGGALVRQIKRADTGTGLADLDDGLRRLLHPMLAADLSARPDPDAWLASVVAAPEPGDGRPLARLNRDAAEFLSDVEDEVPAGYRLDPRPDPGAVLAATEAAEHADRAAADAEAIAAALEAARTAVNLDVPGVSDALVEATRLAAISDAAAEAADAAAEAAGVQPNAEAAEAQRDIATQGAERASDHRGRVEVLLADARTRTPRPRTAGGHRALGRPSPAPTCHLGRRPGGVSDRDVHLPSSRPTAGRPVRRSHQARRHRAGNPVRPPGARPRSQAPPRDASAGGRRSP